MNPLGIRGVDPENWRLEHETVHCTQEANKVQPESKERLKL